MLHYSQFLIDVFRFGSEVISKSTGIILNNEIDDFSFPNILNSFTVIPSKTNFIEPGKRPMSSMCPSIITDHAGRVKLLIGGAGGTKITTGVAIVSINGKRWNCSSIFEFPLSFNNWKKGLVVARVDFTDPSPPISNFESEIVAINCARLVLIVQYFFLSYIRRRVSQTIASSPSPISDRNRLKKRVLICTLTLYAHFLLPVSDFGWKLCLICTLTFCADFFPNFTRDQEDESPKIYSIFSVFSQ